MESTPKEEKLSQFLDSHKRQALAKLKQRWEETTDPKRRETLQKMIERLEAELKH